MSHSAKNLISSVLWTAQNFDIVPLWLSHFHHIKCIQHLSQQEVFTILVVTSYRFWFDADEAPSFGPRRTTRLRAHRRLRPQSSPGSHSFARQPRVGLFKKIGLRSKITNSMQYC